MFQEALTWLFEDPGERSMQQALVLLKYGLHGMVNTSVDTCVLYQTDISL